MASQMGARGSPYSKPTGQQLPTTAECCHGDLETCQARSLPAGTGLGPAPLPCQGVTGTLDTTPLLFRFHVLGGNHEPASVLPFHKALEAS